MANLPFIEGYMPLQMLLELAGLVLILTAFSILSARAGLPVSRFSKALTLLFVLFVYLKFRVYPPMPFSILATYTVVSLLAILLWASSSEQYWQEFRQPAINVLDGITPLHKGLRAFFLIAIPVCAWGFAYESFVPWATRDVDDPVELRTIHPAPPASSKIYGRTFYIYNDSHGNETQNPFRVDESGNYSESVQNQYRDIIPFGEKLPAYLRFVQQGGQIYFRECVLCHGANLSGRGMFASSLEPYPISFTSLFRVLRPLEGDLFWRTAKGWTELPSEGFPWSSSMPPMEQHLSSDEIWKVTLFVYWHTRTNPHWDWDR